MIIKSLNDCAKRDWHVWFAWFPVRINDYEKAWLIRVNRRGSKYRNYYDNFMWSWEYKL